MTVVDILKAVVLITFAYLAELNHGFSVCLNSFNIKCTRDKTL